MKKTFSSKKSAFSLIELSIVLIIIGLLIAGITGGASLIKSSELRSVMGEARGYAVAVNAFYTQFNALPGDYNVAVGGAAYAGSTNGLNGRIEYYASDASAYASEGVAAWNQLKQVGAIETGPTTLLAVGTAQVPSANMVVSKIKSAGWHFDYRNNVGAAGDYAGAGTNEGLLAVPANQNVVVLTGGVGATSATTATMVNGTTNKTTTAILTGNDALSIDTKIDDGYAHAGKVRGLNPAATTACYATSATANVVYTVSATTKVCAITYQVDVNS